MHEESTGALLPRSFDGTDVVVVGGGNAALCAALSARMAGANVVLLERSEAWERGGNSKHTRNVRCVNATARDDRRYMPDEFLTDLRGVTGEDLDVELARLVISRSAELPSWMEAQGVRWQPALRGTMSLSRTNRFFLGGGKALMNTYYARAEAIGVTIAYRAKVDDLRCDGDRVTSVIVTDSAASTREIACRAVVVASGGFEANVQWLRRYWGEAADQYVVRGTPHNDGVVLAALLALGAQPRGNERGFHAVAVDARSPRFDGGIATRVDSIPFGIVVNRAGERFYDEGEDIWPKRYATWGGLVAKQPGQLGFSIVDGRAWGQFIPPMFPPYVSDTIPKLAVQMGVPADALARTLSDFNTAAVGSGVYETSRRDGRCTRGLTPPKSNWALPLDTPPYYGYPLRPGITFTYLGVAVDERAHVLLRSGDPLANVFAAGEIMAGNILRSGYLAGFGMTIGTVFGRIAGEEAARSA